MLDFRAPVIGDRELIDSFTRSRGAEFVFTVAPNKNTLYPDKMPYYYGAKVSGVYNRDLLRQALSNSELSIDLSAYAALAGATFTGAVSGIAPTTNAHFATKKYVDDAIAALYDLSNESF